VAWAGYRDNYNFLRLALSPITIICHLGEGMCRKLLHFLPINCRLGATQNMLCSGEGGGGANCNAVRKLRTGISFVEN
jgi:hypothetical protein